MYKQMMVGVFKKVYTVAPVFRAEKHSTSERAQMNLRVLILKWDLLTLLKILWLLKQGL